MAADVAHDDDSSLIPAAILARVPGAQVLQAVSIAPLAGGRINRTFLVETAEGRFTVRLGHQAPSLPAIDRRAEIAAHRASAAASLAPPVVFADATLDVLITAYAEGRAWTDRDFASCAGLQRLAACLHRLHAIPVNDYILEVPMLDVLARAQEHVALIAAHAPDESPELTRLLARAAEVENELAGSTGPRTLVHGDLHGSNLIDGERLLLIDWEYAVRADPLWDVACLLVYQPLIASQLAALLRALRVTTDEAHARLGPLHWQFQLLNYLWYRARRLSVTATAQELDAERRARQSLENTNSTLPGMWK